jgi:hypothetical protein
MHKQRMLRQHIVSAYDCARHEMRYNTHLHSSSDPAIKMRKPGLR